MEKIIYFDLKVTGEKQSLKEVVSFIKEKAKTDDTYKTILPFVGIIFSEGNKYVLEIGLQNYGPSMINDISKDFYKEISSTFPKVCFEGTLKNDEYNIKCISNRGEYREEQLEEEKFLCDKCGSELPEDFYVGETGGRFCDEECYRGFLIDSILSLDYNEEYTDIDFDEKELDYLIDVYETLKEEE